VTNDIAEVEAISSDLFLVSQKDQSRETKKRSEEMASTSAMSLVTPLNQTRSSPFLKQQSKIRRDTKKPSFVSQNLQSFESVEKWRES
jgi:hypothetical protein